jgi:dCTP deaminase
MILTGNEIFMMRNAGRITIEPYTADSLNPNSYDFHLGSQLGVPVHGRSTDNRAAPEFQMIELPDNGYVMRPKTMYLGHTHEVLGSNTFAMRLTGRSSLGRLGLFLQVSADLGHTGSCHQWTLELVAALPFKLYPKMRIGQISFWENIGLPELYRQGYSAFNAPTPSKLVRTHSRLK